MRWLLPLFIFFGCAHAPPPQPKAQVAFGSVSDLKGKYTGGNDLDWGYFLTIDDDGKLDLVIDRGKLGRCEQRGKLVPGADKQTFEITYDKDECNHDHAAGQKLTLHVDSFTTDELVLAVKGDGVDERRHYTPRHQ